MQYKVNIEIKRAYRYRFYPTEGQARELARSFGSARFVYNHFLRLRTDAWFNEQKRLNYNDTSSLLTRLKRDPEFTWLLEVSSAPVGGYWVQDYREFLALESATMERLRKKVCLIC